jgi:hypothetical protein
MGLHPAAKIAIPKRHVQVMDDALGQDNVFAFTDGGGRTVRCARTAILA